MAAPVPRTSGVAGSDTASNPANAKSPSATLSSPKLILIHARELAEGREEKKWHENIEGRAVRHKDGDRFGLVAGRTRYVDMSDPFHTYLHRGD
jgi:hypothetical protein